MDFYDLWQLFDLCKKELHRYGSPKKLESIESLKKIILDLWNDERIPDNVIQVIYEYYKSDMDASILNQFIIDEINKMNKENKIRVIENISKSFNLENIGEIFTCLEKDLDKTLLILNSTQMTKEEKETVFQVIENEYYRSQIVKQIHSNNFETDKLVQQVLEFDVLEQKLDKISAEPEKAKFIANLRDNNVKIQFLKQIKEEKNRKFIINNLKHKVDPIIKPYTDLVMNMIKEFFEDKLGDKLDIQKMERLEIVFNTTDIALTDLGNMLSGETYHLYQKIIINSRHKENANQIIGILLHEYGHAFSKYNYLYTLYSPPEKIEEGTQDLFAELVINYYIEKHKNIYIGNKKIRIDYPYISYSSYDSENAWQRTMLYPLSQEEGKAELALSEYLLGDKNKYLEMTLGKERAKSHHKDIFGNPDVNTSWREIYEANPQSYNNVNRKSIYYRRNYLIPIFELQKRLENDDIDFFGMRDGETYKCEYIGNVYFKGRKLYQISEDEMAEFKNLYELQLGFVISGFNKFANKKINELNSKEIQEHSFEILSNSLILLSDLEEAGTTLERVWRTSLRFEAEKVTNGQSIEISLKKYRKLIPKYIEILSRNKINTNEYILDAVKDLQFEYIEQIRLALKEGKEQIVLEALKDNESSEIYVDNSILEVLEEFGINIRYDIGYTTKNIFQAASRGVLTLDDINRVKLTIDRNTTQISNEENRNGNESR